jgi:hypothetical protein
MRESRMNNNRVARVAGWLLWVPLAAMLLTACEHIAENHATGEWNQWYYANYEQNMEFVGAWVKKGRIEYSSVQCGDRDAEAIPADCDLQFHWNGRVYLVREIGLAELAEMGASTEDLGNGITEAFMNKQDRFPHSGMEFYLKNGRLCGFYAHHYSHKRAVCPFMLSVPGRQPVLFPIAEDQLRESFGEPESVVGVPGK